MRTRYRTKSTFYYATYTGKTQVTDANGLRTGTYTKTYSTPAECKAHISAAKGEAVLSPFGIDLQYSRTIVIEGETPIGEDSVLWIGVPTTSPYNYVVVRKAVTNNFTVLAIDEVRNGN